MGFGKRVFLAALVLGAFILPGAMSAPQAQAEAKTVLRFASLAPTGSAFMKVMKAWNRSIIKETDGRVEVRFYSGGSQGDERDFVRKIRAGQLDGAGVSTVGLGMIVRPVLVLQAPGLIVDYAQLEKTRAALFDRFAKMFDDAGFHLVAWGDGGKARIFSVDQFQKPEDLKSMRPWVWKDDPVFGEYIKTIGANPVRLALGEVYPGLQTRMVDVAPASAIAAVALQWHTRLNVVAKQNFSIIVGASLVKKEKWEELSPEDRKVFMETGERAAIALNKLVRRDDDRAYDSMLQRGMTEVDLDVNKAEWEQLAVATRNNLIGRVYSKSLLKAVEDAVSQ
jgi:TRAP-type C4-dicarboxylate transport system substrate-binding protein